MGCFSSAASQGDRNDIGAAPHAKPKVDSTATKSSVKTTALAGSPQEIQIRRSGVNANSDASKKALSGKPSSKAARRENLKKNAEVSAKVLGQEADIPGSESELTGSEMNLTPSESDTTASTASYPGITLLTNARVDRDIAVSASRPELDDAAIVVLVGLKGSPELNNSLGCICGFDAGRGRYHVRLLEVERVLALYPDKLEPLGSFRLEGIKSRPEVNGQEAFAVRYLPESGRVEVEVVGLEENLSVRPDHIHLDSRGPDLSPLAREVSSRFKREESFPTSFMSLETAFAVLERASASFDHYSDACFQECERVGSTDAPPGKPTHRFLRPCRGILKSGSRSDGRRARFAFGPNEEELSEAARAVEAFLFEPECYEDERIPNALALITTPGVLYGIASALKFAAATWESPQFEIESVSEDSFGSLGELGETTNLQRMKIAEIELKIRVQLLNSAAQRAARTGPETWM